MVGRFLSNPRRNGDNVVSVPAAAVNADEDVPFSGWQKGFHDERIRDVAQFRTAMAYIQCNAQKHELITRTAQWPWSSLHYPDIVESLIDIATETTSSPLQDKR